MKNLYNNTYSVTIRKEKKLLEEYIKNNFSKVREVTVKPMLVERDLQIVARLLIMMRILTFIVEL